MAIVAIKSNEQPRQIKQKSLLCAGLVGGAIGSAARYILPTKAEMSSLLNKQNFDTFTSSSALKSRGASRSILAFSAIGAVCAALVAKFINKSNNNIDNQKVEYTKLGALLDASPYACEVVWYGDADEV